MNNQPHQRSPIVWFGGKGRMTTKLLPLLPPHHIYVEPFGGGASLLFAKDPSPVEVYNDLDSGVVSFFRVMRDPDKASKLLMLASLTPHSREEWKQFRDSWGIQADEIEKAYRWYFVARQSFAGRFGSSWGMAVTHSSRGMAGKNSSWISSHENLGRVCSRLMRVQIEHVDFRDIVERYDTPQTLFYLDPPYVPDTRSSGEYAHELTADDHRELVGRLLKLQGKALLSGYPTDLYQPLENAGWKRHDYETFCNAVGRTRASGMTGEGAMSKAPRTECVWVSPRAQISRRSTIMPRLASPIHYTMASSELLEAVA